MGMELVRVDTQRAYELIWDKITTLEMAPGAPINEQANERARCHPPGRTIREERRRDTKARARHPVERRD